MQDNKSMWKKPEITIIDLQEFESIIVANANSTTCGGSGGCSNGNLDDCMWGVTH